MSRTRRSGLIPVGIGIACAIVFALATPAAAHGVGGRSDLPLPKWLFIWGAAIALVVSFGTLRVMWLKPRLARQSVGTVWGSGFTSTAAATAFARFVGLFLFAVVLAAAWIGSDSSARNIAPVAVFVVFWVGMQIVSLLFGNVWRALNPFETLSLRVAAATGDREEQLERLGHWIAAAMLFAFVWLELAYFDSASPRAVAVWLTVHTLATLLGTWYWGRGFVRDAEGFAVLFTMISHLAPVHRGVDGRLRYRRPFAGISTYTPRPGTGAAVLVVLGSTGFDGLTRTTLWVDTVGDRTGWSLTYMNTIGLVFVIALIATIYMGATQVMARTIGGDADELAEAFIPSLVPIMVGYTIAHYFSLLAFEGQLFYILASDPFGEGWDLFGTVTTPINFLLVSTDTIAYVQAAAIVIGHVVGVVAAHDRALELFSRRRAERSQYPMLAVMVAFTVGGLALLLGG